MAHNPMLSDPGAVHRTGCGDGCTGFKAGSPRCVRCHGKDTEDYGTLWADGKGRCAWANPNNPAYVAYHDQEWGVPSHDDHHLFEMLVLESFQAGLSWECILNKREGFRRAFDGFDLEKVCAYDEAKVDALMADPAIVRNRAKIRAAIKNARVFKAIQDEFGTFFAYIWGWVDGKVVHETGRTTSPLAEQISHDLKRRGMSFVGPTTVYAYLQSVGVIESHEAGCWLHEG